MQPFFKSLLVSSLIADVIYAWIDPRLRAEDGR